LSVPTRVPPRNRDSRLIRNRRAFRIALRVVFWSAFVVVSALLWLVAAGYIF
jgi:hypothetical protein